MSNLTKLKVYDKMQLIEKKLTKIKNRGRIKKKKNEEEINVGY